MSLFCETILLEIFRHKKVSEDIKKSNTRRHKKTAVQPPNQNITSFFDKRSPTRKNEDGSDGEARKSARSDMRERGFREDDFIETRERRRGRVNEFHDPVNVDDDDDIDRDENDETTPTQSLRSGGKRGTHDWMLDGREIDFPRTRTNGAFRGTVGRRWSRPV